MSDNIYITADDAGIDTDEGRYVLRIWGNQGEDITVNIHSFVLDFYANVKENIGPYAAEAEGARKAVASGMSRADYLDSPQPVRSRPVDVQDAIDAGYALDDPKSPGYHDRMVD
jgi:hypothetical protein